MIIKKIILFFVLSLMLTAVSANQDKNDTVFDYTTCSAFFAVLSQGMGVNKGAHAQFMRMSEKMMDYAVSLPSDGIAGINEDDVAKKMQAEMQKSEASAKNVIRLYAPHCKKLFHAIDAAKLESSSKGKASPK